MILSLEYAFRFLGSWRNQMSTINLSINHRWFLQSSGRTRTWSKPKTTTPLLSDAVLFYFLFKSCILYSLKSYMTNEKKHSETIYASYKGILSTLNWSDWPPFAILLKGQNISYSPALFWRWLAQISKQVKMMHTNTQPRKHRNLQQKCMSLNEGHWPRWAGGNTQLALFQTHKYTTT